ncbi:hypothetical protein V6N13_108730 [Hibiscus sabdariffa]
MVTLVEVITTRLVEVALAKVVGYGERRLGFDVVNDDYGWMRARLSGWMAKIAMVLTAIPTYTMQSTVTPKKTCDTMERLIQRFI